MALPLPDVVIVNDSSDDELDKEVQGQPGDGSYKRPRSEGPTDEQVARMQRNREVCPSSTDSVLLQSVLPNRFTAQHSTHHVFEYALSTVM